MCVRVCVGWARVWMQVTRPCQSVRNDIVTPRHLLVIYIQYAYCLLRATVRPLGLAFHRLKVNLDRLFPKGCEMNQLQLSSSFVVRLMRFEFPET